MQVVIDYREPEVFQTLFSDSDAVSTARLECGDFLVNDHWLFERKTIHDLCVSLVDGRLFRQATALMKVESHPVMVLEGCSRDAEKSNVGRESIQGALITLGLFFGLPVLRSRNPAETVRLMRYTAQQETRFAEGAVHRFGYRPKGRCARQLYVLQGLPGIGKKRAESLLRYFGSIEAVMCAATDELAEVEGIGRSTALAIRNLVAPQMPV